MDFNNLSVQSAKAIAQTLGERLKQARLNSNYTQLEVANLAGLTRKAVLNAEKGQAQLSVFIAILVALDLTQQLNLFLAQPEISPILLAKLQGKTRQRASSKQVVKEQETAQW